MSDFESDFKGTADALRAQVERHSETMILTTVVALLRALSMPTRKRILAEVGRRLDCPLRFADESEADTTVGRPDDMIISNGTAESMRAQHEAGTNVLAKCASCGHWPTEHGPHFCGVLACDCKGFDRG